MLMLCAPSRSASMAGRSFSSQRSSRPSIGRHDLAGDHQRAQVFDRFALREHVQGGVIQRDPVRSARSVSSSVGAVEPASGGQRVGAQDRPRAADAARPYAVGGQDPVDAWRRSAHRCAPAPPARRRRARGAAGGGCGSARWRAAAVGAAALRAARGTSGSVRRGRAAGPVRRSWRRLRARRLDVRPCRADRLHRPGAECGPHRRWPGRRGWQPGVAHRSGCDLGAPRCALP